MKQLQLIVSLSLLSLTLCEAWNDTVPDWERNGYDAVLANLLINQTTLTKITLIEYIEMMSTLRNIQQDKLQLPNRPEPDIATLISESITSEPDQLPYLFQGDIILTRDQMKAVIEFAHEDLANSTSTRRKRGGLTSELSLRWTKFPILYTINTGSGVDANAVQAGINLWQKLTCISFQRLRSGSGDFIEFFKGTGCYSNIGSVGGRQTISIGRGCNSPAIVAHEIGHSLGFWHEQSRFDRDNYIKVLSQNIKDGMEGQFGMEGQRDFQANGYPYDLGSVMHYGRTAFSSDDGDTIETIDKNYMGTIGQRVALSFYDVKNINTAYCNNRCSTKLPCQHNGYTDPKNCNVCRCSEPFGGTLCEKAASTSSSCGTIDLTAKPQYQTISMSGTGNCNWVITAIPNRKIFIQMDKFGFDEQNTCEYDYIEIRYGPDIANTGARMCSSPPRGPIRSSTNKAVIMFRGQGGRFSLRFRQDPPDVVAPITQPTRPTKATLPTTSQPAPKASGWSTWSSWSNCSKACGACGSKYRNRACTGGPCRGSSYESTICNFNLCPDTSRSSQSQSFQFNGDLTSVINPERCTKNIHYRCSSDSSKMCTRVVTTPCSSVTKTVIEAQPAIAQYSPCCASFVSNGQECVPETAAGTTTVGPQPSTTTTQTTTSTPGGEWLSWSSCSTNCGGCGRRYRSRNCPNQPCSGESVQEERCGFNACGGRACCQPYVISSQNLCVKPDGA